MSDSQQKKIQEQYRDLCAQLGDLILQKKSKEAELESMEAAIDQVVEKKKLLEAKVELAQEFDAEMAKRDEQEKARKENCKCVEEVSDADSGPKEVK